MNRLTERRPRSRHRRRALLASVAALALVLAAAIGASSAAALGKQCSGKTTKGLGAFLQSRAQGAWGKGFNFSGDPAACNGSQGTGGTPQVGYVPISSAAALHTWGADDGVLHNKEAPFVGTDIAPSGSAEEEGSMIANMRAALGGSDVVVVPVTQTAIAIVANPPQLPAHPACTVSRINATQLQKVFSGELRNWRQLGNASDPNVGGDCDQAMTRIVRGESAGTTYQFKHYLDSVNPAPLACTGKASRTWSQLQAPFGGESPPNVEWPSNAGCQAGEGPVTTVAGSGGEGESAPLSFVAKNPGTITYGSLPEANMWAPKQIIDVHNGVKPASPESKEGEANCGAAKYTVPAGAAGGLNVDWSQVYGSDPNIGESAKNAYPICTLTFDLAAANSGGLFGNGAGTTGRDYLAYVIAKEGGQADVNGYGYRALPNPVAKAAASAVAQIGGEGEEEEEGGEEEGGEEELTTVLCRTAPEKPEGGELVCPAGEGFSGKIAGTLMPKTVASFKSTGGPELTVICPEGGYAGEFNEDGTSAGNGITSLVFGLKEGCTTTFPGEPEAVVSFENPNYDASRITYYGPVAPNGKFSLARADKAPPLLRIQSGPVCVYQPVDLRGNVINGSPTELMLQGKWELLEESPEGACPTSLSHFAQMTVTQTSNGLPVYVASEMGKEEGGEEEEGGSGTVLCKVSPELEKGVLVCPKGQGFTGVKVTGSMLPETFASFYSLAGPNVSVGCTNGGYSGEFNEDGTSSGNGISNLDFGFEAGCTTTFPGEPEAVVSFESAPFDASLFEYGGAEPPQGSFALAKSEGPVLLRIQSTAKCTYVGPGLKGTVANGSPTALWVYGEFELAEGFPKETCPTVLGMKAGLSVTSVAEEKSLYIAAK
ncbi:MAG TPA: substrate-binding domain-containing protein [Solirubrobacterales bacterium]|nr:substrate-binding domain-containing protein [Solirubrobacterales bacterium]